MYVITNEDNMRLMSRYPDKYFDLAIVDPPYGIKGERGNGCSRKKLDVSKKWDKRPGVSYFDELFRVSKNQIIWGGNYFSLPITRSWVCWYKTDGLKGRSFSEFELAWTSFESVARHYTVEPFILGDSRIHPTQKPVELYGNLLNYFARKGDRILDTHLGSGSIAIACIEHEFDLTACELDKDYFQAAMKRIQEFEKQQLFSFECKEAV